ncbi:MAG: hypothetical protein Q9166_007586 [cf. Caloplaca sp. 2 TL-2023]
MVERCYKEMSSRVGALELREQQRLDGLSTHPHSEDNTSSVLTVKDPRIGSCELGLGSTSSCDKYTVGFTEALQKSWVYRRNNAFDISRLSLDSRDNCSMAWSYLSGISWAEVSNISVIGLPILFDEVYNPMQPSQTWRFGSLDPAQAAVEPLAKDLRPRSSGYTNPRIKDDCNRDDAVLSCDGCGEDFYEEKCWELADHRWQFECFRCNIFSILLDSDTGSILVSDGSLICDNCAYSCSCCGNKVGDLAIWIGDPAYCAGCTKCRNCEKRIENLKYARTSQGVF